LILHLIRHPISHFFPIFGIEYTPIFFFPSLPKSEEQQRASGLCSTFQVDLVERVLEDAFVTPFQFFVNLRLF